MSKKSESERAHVEHDSVKDDLETPWLETPWADAQIVLWGELRTNDYDFRSWAKGAGKDLLKAGCFYEYARECHKFRCLLWLDTRGRKQRPVCGILTRLKRSGAGDDYLLKSGLNRWLRLFSDELIDNKSFADLFQESKDRVNKSLVELQGYSLFPKPVEKPGRYMRVRGEEQPPEPFYPGSQVVSIQIFWRDYTNKQIGEEMERLAGKLRPESEPEPQPKGKGKASSTTHLLDVLSAMRLASWYPISPPNRRAGLKTIRGALTALDHFNEIRLGGSEPVDESNFYSYIREARQFVEAHFHGEQADNAKSWTDRQSVGK